MPNCYFDYVFLLSEVKFEQETNNQYMHMQHLFHGYFLFLFYGYFPLPILSSFFIYLELYLQNLLLVCL